MPVLIEALSPLSDPALVAAVAGHLRRPWARPTAFPALHASFDRWAVTDQMAGWDLGVAVASAAVYEHVPELLRIAADPGVRPGAADDRVPAVGFKKSPDA